VGRASIHAAVDALLDAFDEYRRAPPEEQILRVRDLPIEERAREGLVRSGRLRTVRLGRELWTRPSWLAAALEALPPARAAQVDPEDEVTAAARRRAERLARRSA
jgi:hypothetical protein